MPLNKNQFKKAKQPELIKIYNQLLDEIKFNNYLFFFFEKPTVKTLKRHHEKIVPK